MLFGGDSGSTTLSRIVAYRPDENKWTIEGDLFTPRYSHGVITVSSSFNDDEDYDGFLIIGGHLALGSNQENKSEKCQYSNNDDQLECAYQNPTQPKCEYAYTYINVSLLTFF